MSPDNKPVKRLPDLCIMARYDHERLATTAFVEVAGLIKSNEAAAGQNLFITQDLRNGNYLNIFMSLGLDKGLEQQIRSILFRKGSRYNPRDIFFESGLREEWRKAFWGVDY